MFENGNCPKIETGSFELFPKDPPFVENNPPIGVVFENMLGIELGVVSFFILENNPVPKDEAPNRFVLLPPNKLEVEVWLNELKSPPVGFVKIECYAEPFSVLAPIDEGLVALELVAPLFSTVCLA